ncbi:cobalamin B12-binding domain-containing protein [Actinophytocola sp.]|uniref:cobalamin B12-binding domain-containing protein n=1 Tax=Actinophytocola sp. TaxID=1872138 RepID=UPI003D6BF331
MARRPRVLVAKAGMDGHDRGAKVISMALRDAGMEVIYTGRHVSMEFIAGTAVQEDVDVVGLSILSGAHLALTADVIEHLDRAGLLGNVGLVVGGTVAVKSDRDALLAMGVHDVMPGGTPLPDAVRRIRLLAEHFNPDCVATAR